MQTSDEPVGSIAKICQLLKARIVGGEKEAQMTLMRQSSAAIIETGWPSRQQLVSLMDQREEGAPDAMAEFGSARQLAFKLGSSPEDGIDGNDIPLRTATFGANKFAEKKPKTYMELVCDALHDAVLLLLLGLAAVQLPMELVFGEHPETAWIEPFMLVVSVTIIVNVAAITDYVKERKFIALSKELEHSNKKMVVRGGHQIEVTDEDIVVGDVLAFNAHNLASIPCDGVLLSGSGVKLDESALTGEPEPQLKTAAMPWIVSGTSVTAGSGRMLVIAVGPYSVSGKIRAAVYEEEEEEGSPLFVKLDVLVADIFKAGLAAAIFCLVSMVVLGLLWEGFEKGWDEVEAPVSKLLEYILTALTVLAVAVPEGLPLAINLSLVFSSGKMMADNNLVKHLDACETMGSATTICSDKTGTLTANRMTVRGAWVAGEKVMPAAHKTLGATIRDKAKAAELLGTLIAIDTMDESAVEVDDAGAVAFRGNPTECALLHLTVDMGLKYAEIRAATAGRSLTTAAEGKPFMFSSARKMMSWAVPLPSGGFRLYAKGASEIILGRCSAAVGPDGTPSQLTEEDKAGLYETVINPYAAQAMRTIGLAYRDLPISSITAPEWGEEHATVTNADGSKALAVETELVLLAVVGIEDPLRPEVKPAIERCYAAGIDVRMVTGDNLDTATAIAKGCGILREQHFEPDPTHVSGLRPKPLRTMTGKDFRTMVHFSDKDGNLILDEEGAPQFNQEAFDKVWPYLRVLARSSPEDKLTLAKGLNQSQLFADKKKVEKLAREGITVFPDRQVVAMTGDGTNDAPALKRADVGFAMGIAGTQIAKDACDIVLLDDNFASIVTAARWGRNIYDSICKFLQFQLTVNIAAVFLAILGALKFQKAPIAAVQMLWINLIMDSLASLALSNEPPTERLLHKPPVNRSAPLVTRQMWFNMVGHASYQLIILVILLFHGNELFTDEHGEPIPDGNIDNHLPDGTLDDRPTKHYTIIFNAFVIMTLFNEFNCRKLEGEWNVFSGLTDNTWFIVIMVATIVIQVFAVQYGGRALGVYIGGLDAHEWAFCLGVGAGGLLWQQVLNIAAICTAPSKKGGRKLTKFGGATKFETAAGNGYQVYSREPVPADRQFKRKAFSTGSLIDQSVVVIPSGPQGMHISKGKINLNQIAASRGIRSPSLAGVHAL